MITSVDAAHLATLDRSLFCSIKPIRTVNSRPSSYSNHRIKDVPAGQTHRPRPLSQPPVAALPQDLVDTSSLSISVSPTALQFVLTGIAAYVAAFWPKRPRGSCRRDLIEVRPSTVAGRGLFAKTDIPENTTLGSYPGIPRLPTEMTVKIQRAPGAAYYCFRNKNGLLLDPTDMTGAPSPSPKPSYLPWVPIDVSLSFANEPPKGGDGVNVSVEDDPRDEDGLVFVSIKSIPAGAEIFLDYGLTYDRSGYGIGQEESAKNGDGDRERV